MKAEEDQRHMAGVDVPIYPDGLRDVAAMDHQLSEQCAELVVGRDPLVAVEFHEGCGVAEPSDSCSQTLMMLVKQGGRLSKVPWWQLGDLPIVERR